MQSNPDPFETAGMLLSMNPVPADTIDQLDALRKAVPATMRPFFDQFYEGAIVATSGSPVMGPHVSQLP